MIRRALAPLLFLLIIFVATGCSRQAVKLEQLNFNRGPEFESSNVYNINRTLDDLKDPATAEEDYYFVVIGDTRNMARSYDLSGFNFMAKRIITARDSKGEKRIWNKIKFIVHTGDILYDGSKKEQWENLKKAFSWKDYPENNYPYLKLVGATKPIFPVVGNHDVWRFLVKPESKYEDMARSPEATQNFRDFFNWEDFIASPHIMSPIPAEIGQNRFMNLLKRLEGSPDQEVLRNHYVLEKDGSYRLKIFIDTIASWQDQKVVSAEQKSLDPVWKEKATTDLHRIFRSLGYNTLPVLCSDNMLTYAFEINGLVFLALDSMSRGWHYRTFSQIKRGLYPDKSEQHRLNLFSRSEWNGQHGFYQAVSDYVKKNDKELIPFMHHSALNSSDNIEAKGLPYNLKLMLGVEYEKQGDRYVFDKAISENTFFDDILFFDEKGEEEGGRLNYLFTSCVHYYQRFNLNILNRGAKVGTLEWCISGGGGGELGKSYDRIQDYIDAERLGYSRDLYNQRLRQTHGVTDDQPNRGIEITDNILVHRYHFLVVHVRGGKIIEVYPQWAEKEEVHVRKSPFFTNPKIHFTSFASPASASVGFSLDIVELGLEGLGHLLSWMTWNPSFSVGYFNYDTTGDMRSVGTLTFNPLAVTMHLAGSQWTLQLLGFRTIFEDFDQGRNFVSFGIEAPLIYNFFGVGKRWLFNFQHHIPLKANRTTDPEYLQDIRFSLGIAYQFLFH